MHTHAPEAGLASLLASRGRGGDSVLVHMSPGEVHGLQQLAMASGGSLTINPHTGLYEAGWLKKLLPMIAGALLAPLTGGTSLGSFLAKAGSLIGGGAAAGTGLLVGGVEALRTGSLKKGLMAGLGAYGGASLGSALSNLGAQAKTVATQAATEQAKSAAAEELGLNIPDTLSKIAPKAPTVNPFSGEMVGSTIPSNISKVAAPSVTIPGSVSSFQPDLAVNYAPMDAASGIASYTPSAAAPTFSNMWQGVKSLGTAAGRERAGTMLANTGTFSRGLAALPLLSALGGGQEEGDMPTASGESDMFYIPGTYDPNQPGADRSVSYFQQGKWYKRKPGGGYQIYNPYALNQPTGMAQGGVVPAPNQMYPMANIQHSEYASSIQNPRKTEVVGGYDAAINPFTGEEVGKQVNFADGGETTRYQPKDPPRPTADSGPPTQGLGEYYQSLLAAPATPRDTSGITSYLANLNQSLIPKAAPPTTPPPVTPPPTGGNGGTGGTGGGGTGTGTGNDYGYVDPYTGEWIWVRPPPGGYGGNFPTGGMMNINSGQQAQPTQPMQPTEPVPVITPYIPTGPDSDFVSPFASMASQPVDVQQTVQMPDYETSSGGLGAIRRNQMMDTGMSEFNFGFAGGGMTGEYKAGGRLLDGPGDGMSDDIPAVIRGKQTQRAALADGEFVVPADVVSHLGNGSTKAGAKKLYSMMDKVRKARTGTKRQAPRVKTDRYLPA